MAEGCNIAGKLSVNKVPGNFHIAPGHSFEQDGFHVHDVLPFLSHKFDFTHTVNKLNFGERVYKNMVNPLEGVTKETNIRE